MLTDKTIKQQYLTLGRPIWQIIKESQPERQEIVALRIKDLLAQREMIDIELELLGYKKAPVSNMSSGISISLQSSLSGFHNPHRHKGLTPEQFLDKYLYKPRPSKLTKEIDKNKNGVLAFIRSRFSRTIKLPPDTATGSPS